MYCPWLSAYVFGCDTGIRAAAVAALTRRCRVVEPLWVLDRTELGLPWFAAGWSADGSPLLLAQALRSDTGIRACGVVAMIGERH